MKIYTIPILLLLKLMTVQSRQNGQITVKTEAPVSLDQFGNSYSMTEAEYKALLARFSDNPTFVQTFVQIKRKLKTWAPTLALDLIQ